MKPFFSVKTLACLTDFSLHRTSWYLQLHLWRKALVTQWCKLFSLVVHSAFRLLKKVSEGAWSVCWALHTRSGRITDRKVSPVGNGRFKRAIIMAVRVSNSGATRQFFNSLARKVTSRDKSDDRKGVYSDPLSQLLVRFGKFIYCMTLPR